jgi:hypothetical protein
LAMAFGTMSADLFESSANRSPEPAVLFYVTDDDRAGEEVERLIQTAGFEPVKAGGIEQIAALVGGTSSVGPSAAPSPAPFPRESAPERDELDARHGHHDPGEPPVHGPASNWTTVVKTA